MAIVSKRIVFCKEDEDLDEEKILAHADRYYRRLGGVESVILVMTKGDARYYSFELKDSRMIYIGIPAYFEVIGENIRNITGRESLELMHEILKSEKDL